MTCQTENVCSEYIGVMCEHMPNGTLRPVFFRTEESDWIPIDRVTDVRRAASLKHGGQGMRYSCYVCDRLIYLFHDREYWFSEIPEYETPSVLRKEHIAFG